MTSRNFTLGSSWTEAYKPQSYSRAASSQHSSYCGVIRRQGLTRRGLRGTRTCGFGSSAGLHALSTMKYRPGEIVIERVLNGRRDVQGIMQARREEPPDE